MTVSDAGMWLAGWLAGLVSQHAVWLLSWLKTNRVAVTGNFETPAGGWGGGVRRLQPDADTAVQRSRVRAPLRSLTH